ncbi:MAG: ABC transporter permease, partial [Tannerella sp.]|nr:ABC transporter permease [Tannerella sp.]
MKIILRNFLSVLRRYKLATILNVLGLSVAFAAFMVIMMQVDYDRGFDRSHPDVDKIFRVEVNGWMVLVSRPYTEAIINSSPHIQAGTITSVFGREFFCSVENNGQQNFYEESALNVSPTYTDVFTFDMVEGSDRALNDPEKVLIPLSLARKFFGNEPATGKQLTGRERNYTVGGVYRDFPRNSSVTNVIYTPLNREENATNWTNWSYCCYIRVDAAEKVSGLFENLKRTFDTSVFGEDFQWSNESLRFTPLTETHYVTGVNYDPAPKASRQTLFILMAIALVTVAIAGINYTNFSAALAPRRIRSINTQKVFGGSTRVIRTALIAEGVVIALVAFLLGIGVIHMAQQTAFVSLVEADLSPAAHPGLLAATGGLAILTGLLAGLYPSFYMTSFPPALALKGTFGLSPAGRRLRSVLVGVQYVAAFILIIASSFMYLQNHFMQHAPLGYDRDELLVVKLNGKVHDSRDAFTGQLKSFSGIEDACYSYELLSSGDRYMGWGRLYRGKEIWFQALPVDTSFLRVMGIEMTDGRSFREGDTGASYGAYVFNEKARNEYGLALNEAIDDSSRIVGFIPDVKFASFRSTVDAMAFFIGPKEWFPLLYAYIRVKAGADLRAAMAHVHATLKTFDGEYAFDVRFFDDVLQQTYAKERRLATLITLFSLAAIFIAIMGVFGLVVFDSEYRRKEIGIRKVFGSTTREILVTF